MKGNLLKRSIYLLLVLTMLTSPSAGAASIEDYTDIDANTMSWAGEALAWGVENGIIRGTSDNTMTPGAPLSLAEFATMLERIILTDEDRASYDEQMEAEGIDPSSPWPVPEMYYASKSGILRTVADMSHRDIWSRPVNRVNMAVMLSNCLYLVGESWIDTTNIEYLISDWDSIKDTSYESFVLQCYAKGLLDGVGGGRFDSQGTVTRAAGVVVAQRIMDKDARKVVPSMDPSGPITIYEGRGAVRPAQLGDTYVRPDGTKITLAMHENGVLGWGQGYVDYYSNTLDDHGIPIKIGDMAWVTINGQDMSGVVYKGTQGVFTADQWNLVKKSTKPTYNGKTDGETTADSLWVWFADDSEWAWAGPRI